MNPPIPLPFLEYQNSTWLALLGLSSPFCWGKLTSREASLVSKENTQCIWEKTEMKVRQSFIEENVGKVSL